MVTRRKFMKIGGTAAPILIAPIHLSGESVKFQSIKNGPLIKKFTLFKCTGSFYRYIGPNAYDKAPKGINGLNTLFKVELQDGTVGLGTTGYSNITDDTIVQLKRLIGTDPLSLYQWDGDQISGVPKSTQQLFFNSNYGWIESGILDAVGKLTNKPVWKLMGSPVRDGIDPYDGTLYFEDILNKTDARIIGEIGRRIKNDGYRAIKIKLGRPDKWLPGEAGLQRDIEAFIALREACGYNITLMADANNGYKDKRDWAVKLLEQCAPYEMYFIEELFPDNTKHYKQLRETLLEKSLYIPIAEGESIRAQHIFEEYCRTGIYNYIQPDMPTNGFSKVLHLARIAQNFPHVKLISHVWKSQLGLIMSLHASKIQANIPFVEDSRYLEHTLDSTGYYFMNGQWFIPNKPGWGIDLVPFYDKFIQGDPVVIE